MPKNPLTKLHTVVHAAHGGLQTSTTDVQKSCCVGIQNTHALNTRRTRDGAQHVPARPRSSGSTSLVDESVRGYLSVLRM